MLGAVIHDAVAVAGDLDRDLVGYRGIRTIGALFDGDTTIVNYKLNICKVFADILELVVLKSHIARADLGSRNLGLAGEREVRCFVKLIAYVCVVSIDGMFFTVIGEFVFMAGYRYNNFVGYRSDVKVAIFNNNCNFFVIVGGTYNKIFRLKAHHVFAYVSALCCCSFAFLEFDGNGAVFHIGSIAGYRFLGAVICLGCGVAGDLDYDLLGRLYEHFTKSIFNIIVAGYINFSSHYFSCAGEFAGI